LYYNREEKIYLRDPVIRFAGDQAILVEFEPKVDLDTSAKIRALEEWLKRYLGKGIKEYIPGYCTLLVDYDPMILTYSEIEKIITNGLKQHSETITNPSRLLWIPVCYGGEFGPDLEDVAQHNGISSREVIKIHSEPNYFVHFTGFLPSFPFLGGMSKRIATPRMPTPRLIVPGGSVGIAGEQTGLYPIDSPGGWRLIGRVPAKLYDPRRSDPFIIHAGDWLKFYPITIEEYREISQFDRIEPYPFKNEDNQFAIIGEVFQ
jgi:inhibitor of KinA